MTVLSSRAKLALINSVPRAGFEHILGAFQLVFPDNAEGRARKDALLAVYDRDLLAH